MKWAECRTEQQKRQALRAALQHGPTMTAAAAALGVNRQYLYELISKHADTDTPDSVGAVGATDTVGRPGRVGPTGMESLTYSRRAPTFRSVESMGQETTVRIAIDLPKSSLDWLESEALRRKQAGRQNRPAKSPVVVEALDLLRAKLMGGDE